MIINIRWQTRRFRKFSFFLLLLLGFGTPQRLILFSKGEREKKKRTDIEEAARSMYSRVLLLSKTGKKKQKRTNK